jgi:hypothetical protein
LFICGTANSVTSYHGPRVLFNNNGPKVWLERSIPIVNYIKAWMVV